jgi:peptidoglycan/xylan/chitin deacetylase (PgdA/CDA1 family)
VARRRYTEITAEAQPNLTAEDLRAILKWVGSRFTFLAPDEFLGSSKSGVLLTFDDGLANNLSVALPVLDEFGAPAVFFVSTQHVAQPRDWLPATRTLARKHWKQEIDVPDDIAAEFYNGMSEEELQACGRHPLITIGSHTVSHPFLTQCSPDQLRFELEASKEFLTSVTGQAVDLFAYPTGDYNRSVAECVRSAGYRAAFALDGQDVGLPHYEFSRIGLYSANEPYLGAKLSGLHRRPIKVRSLSSQA